MDGADIFSHASEERQAGVAVLLPSQFPYGAVERFSDPDGRLICLEVDLDRNIEPLTVLGVRACY